MIIEPIKIEIDKLADFIVSPVQNQEQKRTQIKVVALILIDFGLKI